MGDPHIHTTVGDCHPERCRTRNLAYLSARYAYGLDFVAIADHVSWAPRGTAGKWYDNLAACELYNEPGDFSALYCYETSMKGGRGGDCNIYLRQPSRTYVDPWPEDLNIAGLCKKVEGDFFAVTFCRWLETEAHRAQPGLTAVMAEGNNRYAIWDAIRARRCYAACGERIWGCPMRRARDGAVRRAASLGERDDPRGLCRREYNQPCRGHPQQPGGS